MIKPQCPSSPRHGGCPGPAFKLPKSHHPVDSQSRNYIVHACPLNISSLPLSFGQKIFSSQTHYQHCCQSRSYVSSVPCL
eukprot:14038355-Ditylum_brightwellii.AAC.1